MSEIVEFLLARLDEQEAWASILARKPHREGYKAFYLGGVANLTADDVLAEVEAKRRMVALLVEMDGHPQNVVGSYAHSLLCLLALPYADHEHYRQEWRP